MSRGSARSCATCAESAGAAGPGNQDQCRAAITGDVVDLDVRPGRNGLQSLPLGEGAKVADPWECRTGQDVPRVKVVRWTQSLPEQEPEVISMISTGFVRGVSG